MRSTIAIDPGTGGGIAWTDRDGIVHAEPMPDGMTAIIDRLRSLAAELPGVRACVERVGTYMPGNSGPAAATFARHCGWLDAGLYACGIALAWHPTPQQWMKALGSWPVEKADRKRAIREAMQRMYPHINATMRTADALGLLTWATKQGAE